METKHKIVNLSGWNQIRTNEKLAIHIKYAWPLDSDIYSASFRFVPNHGLRAGYTQLLDRLSLTVEDIDENTLVIVPNIKNAVQAARELFGMKPRLIVNIADISETKQKTQEDNRVAPLKNRENPTRHWHSALSYS